MATSKRGSKRGRRNHIAPVTVQACGRIRVFFPGLHTRTLFYTSNLMGAANGGDGGEHTDEWRQDADAVSEFDDPNFYDLTQRAFLQVSSSGSSARLTHWGSNSV
ncbi:hypothetical protein EXIGLDRAFT_355929 [Exidia glandulosa HHB12029]|uniref:Uncharacterized protein n=1 Tax=Exidia glandulosa HHB12029 TaxID=1314781 RepID=A0A165CA87_EXIGL|nr:hypothetical protein EXIGLDRAFT_355929 [Exidia glandulosa HHB12029]